MKRVKKIITVTNWMDALHFVFYDFFYTDLIMHKQGAVYVKELYQKKTIERLKKLFIKIRKVIKKNDYEVVLKELKKPEEKYLKILKEDNEKWLGKKRPLRVYVPEKSTKSIIFISYLGICEEILEKIENNKLEKIDIDNILKTNIGILKGMHESFRKELQNYGYIIKKEKKVKFLRK